MAGRRWQGVTLYAGAGNELRPYEMVAPGVARISAGGIVWKRFGATESDAGFFHDEVLDLDMLDRALASVREEEGVEQLILELDSPGGYSTGVQETATRIMRLRESGMEVVGYTEMMACSAGYWLLAAADEIWAAPSAMVGSVGAYIALLDLSALVQEMGVEVVVARSGALKGLGIPGKPVTPEERAFLQESVDRLAGEFKAFVTLDREVAEGAMEGQWFDGPAAAAVGLVDVLADSAADVIAVLGA